MVRGGGARRDGRRPGSDLPPEKGRRPCRRLPKAHHQGSRARPRRHGGAEGAESPDLLALADKLWDTPDVAHDNPTDQRFHASLILGFADAPTQAAFFHSREIQNLSSMLAPLASVTHAYDVCAALTYVKDGAVLPPYQQQPGKWKSVGR
jgi:hypothetical protein